MEENEKKSFCRQCGNKYDIGMKFCIECGNEFAKDMEVEELEVNKKEGKVNEKSNIEEIIELDKDISEEIIELKVEEKIKDGREEVHEKIEVDKKIEKIKAHGIDVDNKPIIAKEANKGLKISNTLKYILLSVIVIMVVVFCGIKVTQKLVFSPEKTVDKFKVAIINGDSKEVKKLITSTDTSLGINDENIEVLSKYFKSNQSKLNEICDDLKREALDNVKKKGVIYIEKESGINGILGKYKLKINPIFVTISSGLDNVKIYINDKEVGDIKEGDTKEFGPFIPGEYTVFWKIY